MAPLPTFALEPRRHINKQLEVLTSSLVSNTAGVNVDLDTRHEMLLDVKPGDSDGSPAIASSASTTSATTSTP